MGFVRGGKVLKSKMGQKKGMYCSFAWDQGNFAIKKNNVVLGQGKNGYFSGNQGRGLRPRTP